MTRLPVPPAEDSAFTKNTKEQYEALGRFVEAFETMVSAPRDASINLLGGSTLELVDIALHHQALTAKPLFEIWRAAVAEIVQDAIGPLREGAKPLCLDTYGERFRCTPAERDAFFGVLGTIAGECNDLINTRNNLLHATWFIGYQGDNDPDCAEFHVHKSKATKTGLSRLELPKNASQLKDLANRCEVTQAWISWLQDCLGGSSKITERFKFIDKQWHLTVLGGTKTTLPQK